MQKFAKKNCHKIALPRPNLPKLQGATLLHRCGLAPPANCLAPARPSHRRQMAPTSTQAGQAKSNCKKIAKNYGNLRKTAKNCGKLRKIANRNLPPPCLQLHTSQQAPHPSASPTIKTTERPAQDFRKPPNFTTVQLAMTQCTAERDCAPTSPPWSNVSGKWGPTESLLHAGIERNFHCAGSSGGCSTSWRLAWLLQHNHFANEWVMHNSQTYTHFDRGL